MLDDFKNEKFYQYASNLKRYYHAYLFLVDDIEKEYPLILAFVKKIICPFHYSNNENCNECNICNLIDKNYYEDFNLLTPENDVIKKEQIINLQKKFGLKSSNNTNQVYIIKEADKMNESAAASLLKFLEEPEPGIYGIFITTNQKKILPTILSRCLLISLKSNQSIEYNYEILENCLSFFKLILEKKEVMIAYLKQSFFSYYKTREEVFKAFSYMEILFDNAILLKYNLKSLLNSSFCDIIKTSLNNVPVDKCILILEKINIYKTKLSMCKNINLNLFMDRFIIDVARVI